MKNISNFKRIEYPNGEVYFGELKNKKREGYGTLTYTNGDKYIGYFVGDTPNGIGKYIQKQHVQTRETISEIRKKTFWTDEKIKAFLYKVADKVGRPKKMPKQFECRAYAPNPGSIINIITRYYSSKTKTRTTQTKQIKKQEKVCCQEEIVDETGKDHGRGRPRKDKCYY